MHGQRGTGAMHGPPTEPIRGARGGGAAMRGLLFWFLIVGSVSLALWTLPPVDWVGSEQVSSATLEPSARVQAKN